MRLRSILLVMELMELNKIANEAGVAGKVLDCAETAEVVPVP